VEASTTVTCPKCQFGFPLTAAIEQPIVERLRVKFEADSQRRELALKAREDELARVAEDVKKARESVNHQVELKLVEERKRIETEQSKKAEEAVGLQLRDLQQQVQEKTKKLTEAQQAQLAVMKEKRQLDEAKLAFELEKTKQIDAEREKIRTEAKKAAMETTATEMSQLQETLNAKENALRLAQEAELTLRKEKAAFEEQKKSFELEVARRADEVKETVARAKDEEFRLKEAEFNKKHEEMKRQIDELKRKAEQGSQQTQGEVLELDLEASLRRCFSEDEISPVGKGIHGGDIIQQVLNDAGRHCGTIIWESKRTKAWSDGWIDKLKEDRLAAKAQIAVIVSTVMPKGVVSFECREDVWIVPPALAVPLASALRTTLIETAAARRAVENRHEKMEVMYAYLVGPEFKGRVTAIVDAFTTMRDDLEIEKRSIQKLWAKREKLIDRVLGNTSAMHGEMIGIMGTSLPGIDRLELPALVDEGGNGEAMIVEA
jgi:hypothetical protein